MDENVTISKRKSFGFYPLSANEYLRREDVLKMRDVPRECGAALHVAVRYVCEDIECDL